MPGKRTKRPAVRPEAGYRTIDIAIRFPAPLKWMKAELRKAADEEGMTLSGLCILILKDWLRRRPGVQI